MARRTPWNTTRASRTGTPRGTTTVLMADSTTETTRAAPAAKATTATSSLTAPSVLLACRTRPSRARSAGEKALVASRGHRGGEGVPLGGHHVGHRHVEQAVDHEAVPAGGAQPDHGDAGVAAAPL